MLRKFCVFAVLAALTAAPALAVQATTSINMTMPSLVILYYRSAITFNVSDVDLANAMTTNGNPNSEGAFTINGFGGDAAVSGADYSSTATATVTNFWGVRSISNTVNTRVTVTIFANTLTEPGSGDTITLSNPLTDTAGTGTFGSNQVSFAPTGLALQLGDVRFDVDMSGAGTPGTYAGGSILIDAVNV